MQKFCQIILLIALISTYEALPQTKWSTPIGDSGEPLTRERRQFPFGEWVPLTKTCPTCRAVVDPSDTGLRKDSIGLIPPRRPTVTRQIHNEGNFFPQDESSILAVPPPPPANIPRQHQIPNGNNFQNLPFNNFQQQFTNSLPLPTQQIFPQTQQVQFLHQQSFLNNQSPLLVNNQQILPVLNNQNNIFQDQGKQQIEHGKPVKFISEFKQTKIPENVVLEQNKRPSSIQRGSPFVNNQSPFPPQPQHQHHTIVQHQSAFGQQQQQQQQQHLNFGDSILTPPPAPNITGQNVVPGIPGLDKEEIQLLYVPVETLRQRGNFNDQRIPQQQNIQFQNRPTSSRPSSIRPTQQTITTKHPKSHFVTQNGNTRTTLKGTSSQVFPTTATPTTIFFQHLPFQQTPQPFVTSATSPPPTSPPFGSSSPITQKYSSPFAPETTLPHLSTLANSIQFAQSDIGFGTTPKSPFGQGTYQGEIITGKPQFSFSDPSFQNQHTVLQQHEFVRQPQQAERQQPQQNAVIYQEQQKELEIQNHLPQQQQQQQLLEQKQQERLLQQQQQEAFKLQQKELERQAEEHRFLQQQRQKELEEQRRNQLKRQKDLEEKRRLQQQKQREEERRLQQQKQKEEEERRYLQKQREEEELRALLQKQEEERRLKKKEEEEMRIYLQKQMEEEEKRLLLKKRKEEEEQKLLLIQQKQKEEEEQRYLNLLRQKEVEEKQLLLLKKQREEEEKRLREIQIQKEREQEERRLYLIQQQQKEEEQKRAFLEQQKKEEERRLLLQKEFEEEQQRLLLLQEQQKQQREQEEQRLFRLQQYQKQIEEEQRQLKAQQLQKELDDAKQYQVQQRLRLQNKKQFGQEQSLQQPQKQQIKHFAEQVVQKPTRLPENDKLNLISHLEKESESDDQLVPHQPPLSVFFKGVEPGQATISEVLRELRRSPTITVLDQYFDKMPNVFVGPAGLVPPAGYGKFELPYLSNIETNRLERKIDRLPFFVAPLNFIPPPGYAKIPFPAPHVGSVVVSSESNPAMKVHLGEKGIFSSTTDGEQAGFPVVGPELPGLINNLETETTTKPSIITSTPSLPQTTAQLRNRRPNIYRAQNRKPITKTRSTSPKPEEVTTPVPKTEGTPEAEGVFRKQFNRFLKRRRPQVKTTTENVIKTQEEQNLNNKQFSSETRTKLKSFPLPKSDILQEQNGQKYTTPFERVGSIDRTTPNSQDVYEIQPTPEYTGAFRVQPTVGDTGSSSFRQGGREYSESNLESFEDGPLPTGSAKTITQELYRPNAIRIIEQQPLASPATAEFDGSSENSDGSSSRSQSEKYGTVPGTSSYSEISETNPTASYGITTTQKEPTFAGFSDVQTTRTTGFEGQQPPLPNSENFYETESEKSAEQPTLTSILATGEPITTPLRSDEEQYTSAFAELAKQQQFLPTEPSRNKPTESTRIQNIEYADNRPTSKLAQQIQVPEDSSQEKPSREYITVGSIKPTQNVLEVSHNRFGTTGSTIQEFSSLYGASVNEQKPDLTPVSPTAPGASGEQYATVLSSNIETQNSKTYPIVPEEPRPTDFASSYEAGSTEDDPESSLVEYYESKTKEPTQDYGKQEYITEVKVEEEPKIVKKYQPEVVVGVTEQPTTTESYKFQVSKDSVEINNEKPTEEDSTNSVKLPNPAIVRVRTRQRGRQRGQANFAASKSTTQSPVSRSTTESSEIEDNTKANIIKEFQPSKVSKYNSIRFKKPVRPTTTTISTEATTDNGQKLKVYTVRPHRRPSPPSTVSTKRIRKPTTPSPTVESSTDIKISTPGPYTQSEDPEYPSSGVSNDVYFENTSLSPVRQKFRKQIGGSEPKIDVVPAYISTAGPSTVKSYLSTLQDSYSEESDSAKDISETAAVTQESSEKYPEWNPSESSVDVSKIVLTTIRTSAYEEQDEDSSEEPTKKTVYDNKKAFDPDLEKKGGRRRVRVRVHKRPHENFETAESQNLRTVANVLVPPTSTYKPVDDVNIHQLAKNSDFSFGGSKLFGSRSREYFRKRLNLTENTSGNKPLEENVSSKTEQNSQSDGQTIPEKLNGVNIGGYVRKVERSENNESDSVAVSSEGTNSDAEGHQPSRPLFRGYVRKVIKHGVVKKDGDPDEHREKHEERQVKEENGETLKQNSRVSFGGGKFNGTRHRTVLKLVKKNKVKTQGTESQAEPQAIDTEIQSSGEHQAFKIDMQKAQQTEAQSPKDEVISQVYPVYKGTQPPETVETKPPQTQQPVIVPTKNSKEVKTKSLETEHIQTQEHNQETLVQTTQESFEQESESIFEEEKSHETEQPKSHPKEENQPSSSLSSPSSSSSPASLSTPTTESYINRFKLHSRPAFPKPGQRPAFHPTREHTSTTEHPDFNEKRDGPIRPKYGKNIGFGASGKSDDIRKTNENLSNQNSRNRNFHSFEVKKYSRTKNREGGISQFSKNKHFTSEKVESLAATTEIEEHESITTPTEKTTVTKEETTFGTITPVKTETITTNSEPKTAQPFTASTRTIEDHTEFTKYSEETETIKYDDTESIDPKTDTEQIKQESDTEGLRHVEHTETTKHEDNRETIKYKDKTETTRDIEETVTHSTTTVLADNSGESETKAIHSSKILTTIRPETTTERKFDILTTLFGTTYPEYVEGVTETETEKETLTERDPLENQPDIYRFSKNSFNFDDSAKFIGTKYRAHVRNITTDILENTDAFSAPGLDKPSEQIKETTTEDKQETTQTDYSTNEKTEEATTEIIKSVESETEADIVTKSINPKLVKTSTTTKVSHETEICYKGKCIRTKSENPEHDLKILVASAGSSEKS